jgi:ribosomal protein S12 methylthiotransferase
MQETPNVIPYLDLPLQHSHPEMLRAMNRPWQGQVNDKIIENLRQALPAAVMRTTFIVGFPGETAEHFAHLEQFVSRHQFDHVGVFTFSAEAEAPAGQLPNQIAAEIMTDRHDRIMAIQQPISLANNQKEVGKVVDVLVEQENPTSGEMIGRSARFAPEVDGQVYVRGDARLGSIVPVRISRADHYDLFGEVVAF